jgi:hypothetical protein
MEALRRRLPQFAGGAASGGNPQTSPLELELRRITHSQAVDVPKDGLLAIVQASQNEDDRRLIMRHLHACLSESSSSLWRRVFLGLAVVDELVKNGDDMLLLETCNGHHFDLEQRLAFLEKYEYGFDSRVESMIRRKAGALRQAWRDRQSALEDPDRVKPQVQDGSAAARDVKASTGTAVAGVGTQGLGGGSTERKVAIKPYLNGVASVGFREDTDSESDDEGPRTAAAKPSQKGLGRAPAAQKRPTADTAADLLGAGPAQASSGFTVDLLGGLGAPAASAGPPADGASKPQMDAAVDLLGFGPSLTEDSTTDEGASQSSDNAADAIGGAVQRGGLASVSLLDFD